MSHNYLKHRCALTLLAITALLSPAVTPTAHAATPLQTPKKLAKRIAAQRVDAVAARTPNTSNETPQLVSSAQWPSQRGTVPLDDPLPHDENGVRLYLWGGKLYNHPVAQAQYGMRNLVSYNETHNPQYLQRAQAQADQLIRNRIIRDDAWYYPYWFNHRPTHSSDPARLGRPWFSAMAQGEALSLFLDLAKTPQIEPEKQQAYIDASHHTFESLLQKPAYKKPWVVWVDSNNYLWLEEYPQNQNPDESDRTFNGHIWALYGVWAYAVTFNDPRARLLFAQASATVLNYVDDLRTPGGRSVYCLHHKSPTTYYHSIHIGQLETLAQLTGDQTFQQWANIYRNDSPYEPL